MFDKLFFVIWIGIQMEHPCRVWEGKDVTDDMMAIGNPNLQDGIIKKNN